MKVGDTMRNNDRVFRFTCLLLLLSWGGQSLYGQAPDLTQTVDFERQGDFHLGPTGLKGWLYTGRDFMTTDARQILVTEVESGSAAEGKLQVGDVVLGIGEQPFSGDARRALGLAIDQAERDENNGVLKLLRWRPVPNANPRQGTQATVELKLNVLGSYSDTAPWDCPKTQRIRDDALKVMVSNQEMGRLGATALALLATGEKEHVARVRQYLHEAKWAQPDVKISVESGGMQSWFCGYHNLVLTEYYLATGDEYVLPAIREHAVKISMGQSNAGTWGHGFAWTSQNDGQLHGGLSGYGALNQAGLPCLMSLLLARKCGVEHAEVDAAIDRATRFFQQFIGHGSIGYGFHRPSLEINANGRNGMSGNGKNGLGALMFRLAGHAEGTRFFSRLTASLYNTCEYGHSGNSYSYFWDPLGANCGGPKLVAEFLKELRWYHALTRKADGSFVYQPLGGQYGQPLLSPTAAQVLIASLPRRAIFMTGKESQESDWLEGPEVRETIASGRWRQADVEQLRAEELVEALDDWSPIAREWVAKKLASKEAHVLPRLVQGLSSEKPEMRAGALAALGYQGEEAASALPLMTKALMDQEPEVSIAAGYAIARVGKSSRQALPALLQAVVESEEPELMKPRQQALAYAFGYAPSKYAPLYFEGILPQFSDDEDPLAEVDRELLYSAIGKLFQDSSGRTRESAAYALNFFDRQDTAVMAQQIHNAIKHVALNYRMMDDGVRAQGLDLMARFRIKEGIPLCFETFDLDRWGAVMRVPNRLRTLQAYGGNAKAYLPQLRGLRQRWKTGTHREMLEETIQIIEEDRKPLPMISLHDLVDERLEKDLRGTQSDDERIARCRQLQAMWPEDYFYQAAALRRMVALRGEEALQEVVVGLGSSSDILHDQAVVLAVKLPGTTTESWVQLLKSSKGNQLAGVLDVLGQRQDPQALDAVRAYAEHAVPKVREAAKAAVTALEAK